jgi:hypothetical protein
LQLIQLLDCQMNLPPHIVARIRDAVASLPSQPKRGPDSAGKQYGGIPLLADMGGVSLLVPDGRILEVTWDSGTLAQPLSSYPETVAIVAGAQRYPWLSELIPARPEDAVVCSVCSGSGKILKSGGRFFCGACGALGWREPVDG